MPNLVKHEINNRIGKLVYGKTSQIIKSHFTGKSVELSPEAVALYHYIIGSAYIGDIRNADIGKQIFKSHFAKEYDQLF